MNYAERLRDPRWQRRRLEILQRNDFKCEKCRAADKTLHVNHKVYRKGAMPWDYRDHELEVLCADCHEEYHQLKAAFDGAVAHMNHDDLVRVLGYVEGILAVSDSYPQQEVRLQSWEHAQGVSDSVATCTRDVEDLINRRDANERVSGGALEDLWVERSAWTNARWDQLAHVYAEPAKAE